MKVSVLVPCCNVEKYVRQCLESIQRQTYTNLEVICIDDGSIDSTGIIIDDFVATDNRFKVIHKSNTGYGDSMNQGLEMCTGDYIGIVESDDWIEPMMYEVLLDAALANNLDSVKCLWYEGPTATERVRKWKNVKKNHVFCPLKNQDVFLLQPSIWSALYRRDLLEEGRKIRFLPTPGASYQDASFAFKAYTKSNRFMMLDKPYHHYRIHPGSSVSSPNKVLCLLDEWNEERAWLQGNPQQKQALIKEQLFARIVYGGFRWNYNRINLEQKRVFIERCSVLFRGFVDDGLFDMDRLKGSRWGERLLLTIHNQEAFYQYFVRREKRRDFWIQIWNLLCFKHWSAISFCAASSLNNAQRE